MKTLRCIYNFMATVKALFTSWPPFLLKSPRRVRFLFQWLYTLRPGAAAFKDGLPLVPFGAIEWLEAFLTKDMNVFEYGSGGSTLFIAERVKRLISVEHDPKWYFLVSSSLKEKKISNCEYILKEPSVIKMNRPGDLTDPKKYLSKYVKGVSFKDYCQAIDSHPNNSFDLVFIDGRARPSCVYHALTKVRSGGFLLLDDTYRERYKRATELLRHWSKKEFHSPKPYVRGVHQATVWQKPL